MSLPTCLRVLTYLSVILSFHHETQMDYRGMKHGPPRYLKIKVSA